MSARRAWAWVVAVSALVPLGLACGNGSQGARVLGGGIPDSGSDTGATDDGGALETGTGGTDSAAVADTGKGNGGDAGASDAHGLPPEDGAPPDLSQCMPADGWATVTPVASIASAGFDIFGSVSPNGTTAAWTTSAGVVYVADRASTTAAFGAPAQLPTGGMALSTGRVALDPLGLKLVATLADGSSFVAFVRASAGAAWMVSQSNEFGFISSIEGGGVFSNPVLSGDGLALYYVVVTGKNAPVFVESPWDVSKKQWGTGNDLPNPDFAITGTQLRRPTGASSDRLTLFFFDEVAGHERVAYRNDPSQAFDYFVDLPGLPEATPSDDCLTLYLHPTGQGLSTAQ